MKAEQSRRKGIWADRPILDKGGLMRRILLPALNAMSLSAAFVSGSGAQTDRIIIKGRVVAPAGTAISDATVGINLRFF